MRIFVVLFLCISVVCSTMSAEDSVLDTSVLFLESGDYLEVTEASRALFDAGEKSIPFLISTFLDESAFLGLCGNRIRHSEVDFSSMVPVNAVSTTLPDGDKPARPSVREASLYLLLAILKGNLYFAEDCTATVTGEEDRDRALSQAAGELAILYIRSKTLGSSFSLETVEKTLRKFSISFSADTKSNTLDKP